MSLHFEVFEPTAPSERTIVLSPGLGGSAAYWEPQIEALRRRFRVVTYDHRGTGRSGGEVPAAGGIAAMADDVEEIAAALGLRRFSVMGHALGGLIGLELALRRPEAIEALVLVNAWSRIDPHTERCFRTRIELLEGSGIEAYVRAQPLFLYPAPWMSAHIERLEADDRHGVEHFQGRQNLLRRIEALRAFDVDAALARVAVPSLVLTTRDDLLVPYTRSVRLADGLANARLALLDVGGHAVNITEPVPFNAAVETFFRDLHESLAQ